ncbi:MFS transporter [Thermoproteus tenax]|uniref:Permease of the major facilitator superfamily n=1 Tax=Thermoproteus tenax (strain ATCC 35583 / DSM 2078 / JCM 9277 / NBRC 100435 / Kra 1) TaxID=768679 RepID=G4RJQ7_THETK|nr:MFS transporter [Thermoproteus tenax]CCC81802.1 permease of the major facilitator superfamily [Thermoproteus tenax Kra 1]
MAIQSEVLSKKWKYIIPVVWIAYLWAFIDRVNIGIAALGMKQALGLTDADLGLAAGIFFIGYFILEIPGTYIVERYSARKWIARILISWGLITMLTGFVQDKLQLYAARFALGLAEASFFPGIIVYLTHWFLEDERARAVSLFMSAIAVANVVTSPLSGWLLTVDWFGLEGWRWVFIVEGIPAVLWGLAVLYLMPDWPREAKWLREEEKRWLEAELARERASHPPERVTSWATGLKDPLAWALAAVYFFGATGLYGITIWSPTVLKALTGGNPVQIGVLNAVLYFAALLAMVFVGRSSDRSGERFLHTALPLIFAALGLLAVAPLSTSAPVIAFAALALAAMGIYAFFPPFWPIPQRMMAGESRAVAIALINSVGNLGGFFGPYIVGYLNTVAKSSYAGLAFLAGAVVASSLILLGVVKPALSRGR